MKTENPLSGKQLEANRRNAQHSTGPLTESGKKISSHNSRRHGFTGRVNLLTPENRQAHDEFCSNLIDSLNPETPMERQFAHSIAEDSWRLNGLRAAENNLLAECAAFSHNEIKEALQTAHAYQKHAGDLQLFSLYEQRINRAIHRNLTALKALQFERKAERGKALEEAKLLTQLSLTTGAACNSEAATTVNGFVFSTAEINTAIDRDNRLNEARDLAGHPPATANGRLTKAA
ncbi:MAG TPA: hypothetical protein VG273_23315 [Bryobacteraceae bacterium]|jgi:hypothetical protein|nr:hypothetical protein [Bryobacteraceae bacterium]